MKNGLSTEEAAARLAEHGLNLLPQPKPDPFFLIFARQFLSPLIYVLLIAAAISFFLHEYSDAGFIFVVLLINAAIGSAQEYSAQKAAGALRKMVPLHATVIRDGAVHPLPAEQIVPGDVILLESGDKVPADLRLFETQSLSIDESMLTGESLAVTKYADDEGKDDTPLEERLNLCFAGTMVTRGRGSGEVVATGLTTELGRIAASLYAPAQTKPPLLVRMERFTWRISVAMLVLIAILFITEWASGGDIVQMLLLAIALAVAAIPEGLPAAITVTLAIGMRRMAKAHVIIRKLLAVEALGSCTFIATDKTGTLTVNELTAKKIALPSGEEFDVTGQGVSLEGKIDCPDPCQADLGALVQAGLFANEAKQTPDGSFKGDMVDIAFRVLAEKHLKTADECQHHPEQAHLPYESENAYSTSLRGGFEHSLLFVKGSPEKLLNMCASMMVREKEQPLDKDKIHKQIADMAAQGYRVLALAKGQSNDASVPTNMMFLGLVGMIDPLRPGAKKAVDTCRLAGIQVAMITGDHPITARAIADQLGLLNEEAQVVTGLEIEEAASCGPDTLSRLISNARVFARVQPVQKKMIVETLIKDGHFVAVTGDGVNDAPALKRAHVGVAMGKRGTDVARESADLIITDDDFSSITRGVREGRIVYSNIRKVIFLLISTGGGEIVLFLLAMLAGLPMPLLAVQLLWLNLVTNGVQHIALAFEPGEADELTRPPRRPSEPIFNRLMISRVGLSSLVIGGLSFAAYQWMIKSGMDVDQARNLTLLLMVMFENVHLFNARSEQRSIFSQNFWNNPFLIISIIAAHGIHLLAMFAPGLSSVLKISPISASQWFSMLGIAALLLVAGELHKQYNRIFAAG